MSVRLSNPMIAIVWLAFLLPGRLTGGRVDDVLGAAVFGLACLILWTKPAPWESREPARRAVWTFAALQFLCLISYLYALAFKGAQTGSLDLVALPRWLFLGGFVVYLIRHYDESVRSATESAAAAAVYGSWLVFENPGERAYAAALTLCYMLLFSRSRLRLLHSAAAAAVVFLSGARLLTWSAPADVLRLIRLSPVFGWGPARYEILSVSSGQYPLWLARGGALGAVLILAGVVLVASRLLSGEDDLRRRAAAAAFLACAALLLLSGPYLDGFRLFYVTAFLFAAVHEPRRSAS